MKSTKPSEAILNRATALRRHNAQMTEAESIEAAKAELERTDRIMNRARAIRAETPQISFGTAIGMAGREIPE